MINKLIKQAKELVKHNKVKKISETLWDIDERNSVKLQIKKGRNLLNCSCHNDTRFCIESPFCHHKFAVILFELDFYKKLEKLIEEYKRYAKIKVPITIESMINDLENLR
ncbi:MAG: hypothetical protein AABY22_02170 [Nanoarchaeota archaeon]